MNEQEISELYKRMHSLVFYTSNGTTDVRSEIAYKLTRLVVEESRRHLKGKGRPESTKKSLDSSKQMG